MGSVGPPADALLLAYERSKEASVIHGLGINDQRAPFLKYSLKIGFKNCVSKYLARIMGAVSMISFPTIKAISRTLSGGTTDAFQAGDCTQMVSLSRCIGRCTLIDKDSRVC